MPAQTREGKPRRVHQAPTPFSARHTVVSPTLNALAKAARSSRSAPQISEASRARKKFKLWAR
jgi:hypothetical protein